MRISADKAGLLHFIGIGGIGMSGIAEILHSMGYKVQGSDIKKSSNVERLIAKGIDVSVGHDEANLKDKSGQRAALVVISSAICEDNPELKAARAARMPVVRRAEMLAELMRMKRAIVIGGTHGKTTTTSMVGAVLEEGGIDPTVVNGGIVHRYGTNVRMGKGEWMAVEADESDGTFTRLPATIAVITNIDPEHMEQYGSFENVRKAYTRFVQNLPFYGYAVLCTDHPEVQALVPQLSDRRLVTYGFNAQADVRASNLRYENGGCVFDVTFSEWVKGADGDAEGARMLANIFLPMPGRHNVQNALASLAIGYEMGMDFAQLKSAMANFSGVHRRFSKTGEVNGIAVIDDYGHHPVEIAAVLKAARETLGNERGKIIAVAQPHRYSRLHDLFDGFCTCFHDADTVLIADVYEAGEAPIDGADRDSLVAGIQKHGHKDVRALLCKDDLSGIIAQNAKSGDIVVCLGAGDITNWAQTLPAQLETLLGQGKKRA